MNVPLLLVEYNVSDFAIWAIVIIVVLAAIFVIKKDIDIGHELSNLLSSGDQTLFFGMLVLLVVTEALITASLTDQSGVHGSFPARLLMHCTLGLANIFFGHKIITNVQDFNELRKAEYVYNDFDEIEGFILKKYRAEYVYEDNTDPSASVFKKNRGHRSQQLVETTENIQGHKFPWYLKEIIQIAISILVSLLTPIAVLMLIAKGTGEFSLLFYGTVEKTVPVSAAAPSGVVLIYYGFFQRLAMISILLFGSFIVCIFHFFLTIYLPTIGLSNRTEVVSKQAYSFNLGNSKNNQQQNNNQQNNNQQQQNQQQQQPANNHSIWGGFGGSSGNNTPFDQ